jgi:N-acetylglutamate synthase-like GNAT family acetyltransferase
MSNNSKILIRNAREQDIPAVTEIDAEAFAPNKTAETPETFQRRLTVFPDGFIILIAENEIAAFGCSEKWITERDRSQDVSPTIAHQPDGRILCITGLAVKPKFQGGGYSVLLLDKLIEIAHRQGCRKIILETTHAQDLYQERGFKTVQNRMERGVSLDVMSLDIESYGSKASITGL